MRLYGDSDIESLVSSGDGNGGSILITAEYILAFDDSDILSFSQDGAGGNITLNTPAFFGENYIPDSSPPFDLNDRVDINASGAISGIITLPELNFIEDSLTDLPEAPLNPDSLVANSCVSRTANSDSQGRFTISGTGGLPNQPNEISTATYSTGTVQTIPTAPTPNSQITEPQGVYRLTNGRLILSRECDRPHSLQNSAQLPNQQATDPQTIEPSAVETSTPYPAAQ